MLEYTALGFPGVYSSIGEGLGPYDLVKGLTCVKNVEDDWYQAIKGLVSNQGTWDNALNAGKAELANRWLEDEKNIKIYNDLHS
jgi:hypothetical protein